MSHYSHSAIECFKSCPLKYKFNYIIKPPIEKKTSVEAFLGSSVHAVLEKLYKDLKFNKKNTIEELLVFYEKYWLEKFNEKEVEIVRDEYTFDNYKDLGKKYIKDYYEEQYPFDKGKTLGLEEKINLVLDDPLTNKSYNILGFIDRLTMISDTYFEIHDYKTNNKPKSQQEIENDRQLALYSIAIKKMFPSVKRIDLVWHFLAAGMELRTYKEDFELNALEKEIIDDIRTIEHAKEKDIFPLKESALCNWCAYKGICPAKSHEIKIKHSEKNIVSEDNGVKLVDEYSDLLNKKKELTENIDNRLQELKEKIINYSKENNYERITGTNSSVLVREYDSLKLPSKESKERETLEKLIKDSGLWEEVSDLSFTNLSNALKSEIFSSDFISFINTLISFFSKV